MIGRQLGPYVIDAVIGRGAMAVVYRARHSGDGTRRAIKVIREEFAETMSALRALREARVAQTFDHPNVVPVLELLDVDGVPALVMPYIAGLPLGRWVRLNRPEPDEAIAIFRGIVAGVGALHAAGMVHRDLKPANVLIENGVPLVTDFGLVKVPDPTDDAAPATKSGVLLGTPCYMAPEQITNAKGVDTRADLYSLGCMLYELLVGSRPFDGDTHMQVCQRVLTGSYTKVPKEHPEHIRKLVHDLLSRDPSRRPADVEEVLRRLEPEPPKSWLDWFKAPFAS